MNRPYYKLNNTSNAKRHTYVSRVNLKNTMVCNAALWQRTRINRSSVKSERQNGAGYRSYIYQEVEYADHHTTDRDVCGTIRIGNKAVLHYIQ